MEIETVSLLRKSHHLNKQYTLYGNEEETELPQIENFPRLKHLPKEELNEFVQYYELM